MKSNASSTLHINKIEKDLVSIIIPVKNRESLIIETLESIKEQTYHNWECVIVDDDSDDNTFGVIEEYIAQDNRYMLFKRGENHKPGGNGARNYGYKKSKGNYIQWFDSDDLMHKDHLKYKVSKLKENEKIDFVNCKIQNFTDSNLIGESRSKPIWSENLVVDFLNRRIDMFTPTVMWRRDHILKSDELFNENLKRHQETEFFYRLLLISEKCGVEDKVLVYRRMHVDSIQSSYQISDENNLEFVYSALYEKILCHIRHSLQNKKLRANVPLKKSVYKILFNQAIESIHKNIKAPNRSLLFKKIPALARELDMSMFSIVGLRLLHFFYLKSGRGYFLMKKKYFFDC